ncbi:MAG: hypothetical protein AAFQ20_10565 [Bacteroidota bacterium]
MDVSWFLLGAISLWVGLKVKRLAAYKKKIGNAKEEPLVEVPTVVMVKDNSTVNPTNKN